MSAPRPWFRWLLFALCLAVFLAVMGWITTRTLSMERQREESERDSQVQERVRLALWRMDSLASTLLVRENSRPASQYQPFLEPEDLISPANKLIGKGKARMPSPLLGTLPEFVLLHFEIPQQFPGMFCSPQVPTGNEREIATNWYAISPQMESAARQLQELQALLLRHPEALNAAQAREKSGAGPVRLSATAPQGRAQAIQIAKNETAPETPAAQYSAADELKDFLARQEGQKAPVNTTHAEAKPQPPPAAYAQTGESAKNFQEYSKRNTTVQQSMALEKMEAQKTLAKNVSDSELKKTPNADMETRRTPSPASAVAQTASRAQGAPIKLQEDSPAASQQRVAAAISPPPAPATTPADEAVPLAQSPTPEPALVNTTEDLRPIWIEDQLFLVRAAMLDGKARVQGVWLDWPKLRDSLLTTIHDLLPDATLAAIPAGVAQADPSSLVTLPVRLLPGAVQVAIVTSWSPLKRALALAWTCLAAAALAVGFVLHRAILLSERRGAFVSAVTHELRTPLTTFRLYSEMLADEMVPDPAKRREYLQTLCDESTRLTHLVENVLAYSRIERGRTAARVERISVAALLRRIESRLARRAAEAGLDLRITFPEAAREAELHVDALAVEQILFNLVDNASKYAAPRSDPRRIDLNVTANDKAVSFRVRDYGPGLPREQRRKLFQPFQKSATEAAHSAPGVGLGLALCKRLSFELGGELRFEPVEPGASFVLTLPLA